ncbi:MAG TPA: ferredoxin family protein [Verrucomicrobiales bacterium]|jgi:Pyruvate/2-oxoacid:ferredoxin oxidoreductase delta subunit|nr:ferredoxin family protein [Verrucomicrobiales bacterium]
MAIAPGIHILLYEGTGSLPIPGDRRFSILTGLLDRGYSVSRTGAGTCLPGDESTLVVLGEFSGGAAPTLEDRTGQVNIAAHDITGVDAEGIVTLVEKSRGDRPMNQPGQWKPWFPVIDYSRCTNCMQCLSFCLFDVYGVSGAGKIQVQNNDNCKTNCPACSRVCPEVAIMFPKYTAGPINGEPVSESDLKREAMKVDISALLGGDIYSRLRERSDAAKSRFSKERDASKALAERKKCLTKLASDGFIPAEVLASLPSPEEIQRKAVEAAEKAKAALAAQS